MFFGDYSIMILDQSTYDLGFSFSSVEDIELRYELVSSPEKRSLPLGFYPSIYTLLEAYLSNYTQVL